MLRGYAAVFGVETVICGYFRERIDPGAFTDSIANDDVPAQFNHDPNYVLGRTSNKTVRLAQDGKGLVYEVDLNDQDPDALRVGAKVARGDVNGSSFAFSCEQEGDEEWVRDDPAKLPLRIIKRAKLYDVAPVTSPAYETTSVSARSAERAAASAVRASEGTGEEAGEEQAELVAYQGLQTLLAQLAGLQKAASTLIGELIADETESPTEGAAEEDAEESVEEARLTVLQALTAQMRGLLAGVDTLTESLLEEEDEDDAGGADPDVLSKELDLLEY
jgi:HK97 family phage prohead protease